MGNLYVIDQAENRHQRQWVHWSGTPPSKGRHPNVFDYKTFIHPNLQDFNYGRYYCGMRFS